MPEAARLLEELAGQLHALAFDIGDRGLTSALEAEADRLSDAILSIVHGERR